jgi:hypothetical protein
MSRLNSARTFSGSFSRERRARAPTVALPRASIRTTLGVIDAPSALRTTSTFSPSKTAAAEFVVPRSIPRKALRAEVTTLHPTQTSRRILLLVSDRIFARRALPHAAAKSL